MVHNIFWVLCVCSHVKGALVDLSSIDEVIRGNMGRKCLPASSGGIPFQFLCFCSLPLSVLPLGLEEGCDTEKVGACCTLRVRG